MWNKARVKCFVGLVQAIIRKRTVNLRELTASQPGNALISSHYRKFQRFFEKFAMPLPDVSRLILAKIPQPLQGYTLSMDRTNWKLGERHINILTIGVHVGKVCVPLVWKVLPQTSKNGNSNKCQRLYVVSNHYEGKEALALYRQRWGIELLFSNLKKRGFDLEETHLTEDSKLERLMAVVSLSFLFTYGWGLHLRSFEKQTAHIKRQSDFRYGLDSIEEMLFMPHGQRNYREEFYNWLQHGKLVSLGENFVV